MLVKLKSPAVWQNWRKRRLSKVEATKFTEVGYVGKDVESIIRDLVEFAIHMTREKMRKPVTAQAEIYAEERVLMRLLVRGQQKQPR